MVSWLLWEIMTSLYLPDWTNTRPLTSSQKSGPCHIHNMKPQSDLQTRLMAELNPSPGDHQRSLSAASSWGSNYLISGCPRFPGYSPDPLRPPKNGRPKGLHLSIRPITDFSGARDGHMLGIKREFTTTKLWRVSQLEITANQQWKELDYTALTAGSTGSRFHEFT